MVIGSYLASKKFAIRIIAGIWCLTAFILASAYSGNLLSFVVAPISRPLVDSFEDIPKVPGLKVAVDLGLAADLTFSRVCINIQLKPIASYLIETFLWT